MREVMEVVENKFKETEIGLIPEDWEVMRLGEVAEITMGQSPPGDTYNTYGKGIPFLQGKAEFGNISPKHIKYTTKPLKIAKKGSVLISVRAPVGDVNIADMDYCIGRGLASLNLKNGINEFLFYSLLFFKHLIEKESYGSVFKAINKENLARLKIPLPPLEEQRAIADILSTVQNAIEKTEKVINATKQLKKSMMKHLFTYGAVAVDEIDRIKLKESEIGLIPEHWEVVRLGEVVDLDRGISWRKFEEGSKDNGHLIISIPNIKDGYIDFNSKYNHYLIKHIPKNKQIQLNDILFVGSSGSIENVGRNVFIENLSFEGIGFASFVFRARVKVNTVIPKFLYFMANSHWFNYKDYVRRSSDGKYNFQLTEFKSIKIPLPPLDEQQKIANILTTIDQKIQAEEKKKVALRSLFKTLLHQLMTGKIRVR